MAKAKKEYPISSLKILATIHLLAQDGIAPSCSGIAGILSGNTDFDTFASFPMYGALLSLRSKHAGVLLRQLQEKDCVTLRCLKGSADTYYCLTEKGESMAKDFLSRYDYSSKEREAVHPRFVLLSKLSDTEQ